MNKMKKFVLFLSVMLLAFSAVVFAGKITTTDTTGVAQVINTGATVLFKVIPLGGDSDANTASARSIVFYDNVSVRASDSPHTDLTAFTWTFNPGQYCTSVEPLDFGYIYNTWALETEGKTFTNGLVVSGTAKEKFSIQFIDK